MTNGMVKRDNKSMVLHTDDSKISMYEYIDYMIITKKEHKWQKNSKNNTRFLEEFKLDAKNLEKDLAMVKN